MAENHPQRNPDPDPRVTPGVDRGGLVTPGETPPAESSTSSRSDPYQPPTRGWAKGPLAAISVVVLLVAAFFLAYALVLIL